MEPGLHPGVSREEYDRIDAVNQSLLKPFRRSAAHAKQQFDHPLTSAELAFGTAFHSCVLEPEKFLTTYSVPQAYNRRKKAEREREAADLATAKANGKEVITEKDLETIYAMRESLFAHPVAGELLRLPGPTEVATVWKDAETGLLCKALMDKIVTFRGITSIVDLKTTKNATPGAFAYDCHKYAYNLQAAFYLHGLYTLAPAVRQFLFVAVEKEPPYACAVYELDYHDLEAGRDLFRIYLQQLAECRQTGIWPAYSTVIETLQLPYRARSEDE